MMNLQPKPETVNVAAKSQLAKLMATEDITVEHRPQAKTASFNVKTRKLILPVFKHMSGAIYDLLVSHEIGHALETPSDPKVLEKAIRYIAPKNLKGGHSFLNVVEDARIERFVKNRYPGSKVAFVHGYKALFAQNFFRTKGHDFNTFPLIDRLNIHFKMGVAAGVKFTAEELPFVKMVEDAVTFEDAVRTTKAIYMYCKNKRDEEKKNSPKPEKQQKSMPMPEPDDGEDDGSGTPDDSDALDDQEDNGESGNSEDEDNEPSGDPLEDQEEGNDESQEGDENSPESDTTKDSDESEDGAGGDEGDGESGEDEDQEDKDKGASETSGDEPETTEDDEDTSDENTSQVSSSNHEVDEADENSDGADEEGLTSQTDDAWEEEKSKLADKFAEEHHYYSIPKVNLNKIIVDYKTVSHDMKAWATGIYQVEDLLTQYKEFRDKNINVVSYLVKEFEMRKAADQYTRSQTSRTGVIDTNKLHSYKYNEDLFRRITVVPGGKNHGLVMFIDWSGSMLGNLKNTIEQLLNLVHFCKKVQIPYDVYAFTDHHDREDGNPSMPTGRKANYKPDDLIISENFHLLHFLSSRMNSQQFMDAVIGFMPFFIGGGYNVYSSMPVGYKLNNTPLDETIISAMEIVPKFKKDNNVQIVNTVFLTDGDGNPIESAMDDNGHEKDFSMGGQSWAYAKNIISILRDPVTRIEYILDSQDNRAKLTDYLLKALGDRTNAYVIGFFLADSNKRSMKYTIPSKMWFELKQPGMYVDLLWKKFQKDGFLNAQSIGYDEYYIIPADKDHTADDDWNDFKKAKTTKTMARAFASKVEKKMANKLILSRFIRKITEA